MYIQDSFIVLPRTPSHEKNIEERRYKEGRKSFHITKSNCVQFDILNLGGKRNNLYEVGEEEFWNRGRVYFRGTLLPSIFPGTPNSYLAITEHLQCTLHLRSSHIDQQNVTSDFKP
jgi:hypothetical protein